MWLINRLKWYTIAIRLSWREHSFKVGLVLTTLGIVIGVIAGVGMTKLVLLVAIAVSGLGMEIINTQVEKLCDIANPKPSKEVEMVKNAFGAVPAIFHSAYVICWIILVVPSIVGRLS